jgi:DMSO reductase family type II enzyme heme b subunit
MQAPYLANATLDALVDPDAKIWRDVPAETLKLVGTPVGLQPTEAIRIAWTSRKIGLVDQVRVQAAHDGKALAFRLEWEDATENTALSDNDRFPDAAAIALPAHPDAPLVLMGAPGQPVNAWYWRADEPKAARQVSAEGLGTTRMLDGDPARGSGFWKGERWRVCIARALSIPGEKGAAQLVAGKQTRFGVAIWEGSNQERAGIKSFSGDWKTLSLGDLPAGRKA